MLGAVVWLRTRVICKVVSSCLINDGRATVCRHYSQAHLLSVQKLRRLTLGLQQKGWCSVTGSSDQGQDEKIEEPLGSKTSEDSLGGRLGSEFYFNKDILRSVKKKQTEQYFKYTGNIFIDVQHAKVEYLLDDKDLEKLAKIRRRSPYSSRNSKQDSETEVYIVFVLMKDAEKIALEKWGSMEKLQKAKKKYKGSPEYQPYDQRGKKLSLTVRLKEAFGKDSGAVVFVALVVNFLITVFKGFVWICTGSPSLFSEFMHSLLDFLNQCFLATGKFLSVQGPDSSHPYGYTNVIYMAAIFSGTVLFGVGAGFTAFNGILGLMQPVAMNAASLTLSQWVLAGTFLLEGASLVYAGLEIWKKANKAGMSFLQYVKEGDDPFCNVVLLEDMAGVAGVVICGAAITSSYYLGMPSLDACGSLIISVMLLGVSVFTYISNIGFLIGKALTYEEEIKKYVESDRFVNAVLDHKTLDFGEDSRFKSEVVLDAKQITSHYLNTEVDLDALLVKWKSVSTTEDMERFLEEFGVQIYDQIVAHVDRKEQDIKKKFPELRHIDIEPS